MSNNIAVSYDRVPYESKPVLQSHPDSLATVATLFGMQPAPVPGCRVLELGCAAGGNLIPMALTLPESHFFGIDLSPVQIASGHAVIRELGLKNIELREMSITDVDDSVGVFDYIICHGVFSWVPREVQDRILTICSRSLAAHGVAYVSYNTYPGWHERGVVREMMCFHARRFAEADEKLTQSRALVDFVAASAEPRDSPYVQIVKGAAAWLHEQSDSYVYHEFLEDDNNPLYFHQFVERAAAHGLQYLGESQDRAAGKLSADAEKVLQHVATDLIQLEQYLDFLFCRTFRRTLLCHSDITLNRSLSAERLAAAPFLVSSDVAPPSASPDLTSAAVVEFRRASGAAVSTNHSLLKAAFLCLSQQWPRAVALDELRRMAMGCLDQAGVPVDDSSRSQLDLAEGVLKSYLAGLVELHLHQPAFVLEAGERPLASPLARLQAASGARITNMTHKQAELDELDRQLLVHLDGSRDRAGLVRHFEQLAVKGDMVIREREAPVSDSARLREILARSLNDSLTKMARLGLMLA